MTEPEEAGRHESPPAPEAVDPDWFGQIPFNPKTGLNSVLPMELPAPSRSAPVPPDHGERG
jgi:hypothetical protein